MKDEARYKWYHSIPATEYDNIYGTSLKRGTRQSITFRKMILTNKIEDVGVVIPVARKIYDQVLLELKSYGCEFFTEMD